MKNNAKNSFVAFLILCVAMFLFVGKTQLKQLIILIPVCFFIGLGNFVYEEIKRKN